MNRHAPGIAGLCFIACVLIAMLGQAMSLFRHYAPAVRVWLNEAADTGHAWLMWAADPKFFAGMLAVCLMAGVVLLAVAIDEWRHTA